MAHTTHGSARAYGSRSWSALKGSSDKLYHTVTACCRCRQRKTRCDPGLPRCAPCERSNARCEYYDSTKNRMISRTYITSLQDNLRRLQAELASLEKDDNIVPDAESIVRSAGLIKFSENDESRFLGPSSGIAMARLVMEFAKQSTANKSIKDVVPDTTAREIRKKFADESAKPTSKIYPLISSVAAPSLPSHDLMERLVDIYMVKAQYMLPLLHEPSFREHVQAVYRGSIDATLNFQLRLVIAISMQKLDTQYAGLADSYYLAAMPYLEVAVRRMDISTLQCFALIAQYSLLTPTRTASYWVVGLGARLSQELGLCEEKTIKRLRSGYVFNPLEVDMRRRLFWIITSMEYGLSHSLGRPSAFGVSIDHIDVQFFELCDDRFITPNGLLPGHHPIMKKCIAIHFFRMRLLQAEIRRMLYLKKRDTPLSDRDPWFINMQQKIDNWVTSCPKNDEGSGLSEAWFHGRRNTMIIFMYRPSPQIPEPSQSAAKRCYDAAVFNIDLLKHQIEARTIDITWIFTQAQFQSLNAILWSLSYFDIRQQHPLEEVKMHVGNALVAINQAAERWPGVRSAIQLYENLIKGCLKAYESDASFVVHSPSCQPSPASAPDTATSPSYAASYSPASTAGIPVPIPPHTSGHPCLPSLLKGNSAVSRNVYGYDVKPPPPRTSILNPSFHNEALEAPSAWQQPSMFEMQHNGYATENVMPTENNYGLTGFNPSSANNIFSSRTPGLQHWDPNVTSGSVWPNFMAQANLDMDHKQWLGSFGDEYSRYMHQAYFPDSLRMQQLNEQQQSELMANLEKDKLPDVSNLVSESATFYTAQLV